jgi:hypothetical protein
VLELVLEDRLRVEEQAPDQGRLAVVDRPGGGEANELRGMGGDGVAVRARQGAQK